MRKDMKVMKKRKNKHQDLPWKVTHELFLGQGNQPWF